MDKCFHSLDYLTAYSYPSIIHLHSQGSSNCFGGRHGSRAGEVGVDVGADASVQRVVGVDVMVADGTARGLDGDPGKPLAVVVGIRSDHAGDGIGLSRAIAGGGVSGSSHAGGEVIGE